MIEDVGGEAFKNVCVQKISPKKVIDITETFILVKVWSFTVLMKTKSMLGGGWVPGSVSGIVFLCIWKVKTSWAPILYAATLVSNNHRPEP